MYILNIYLTKKNAYFRVSLFTTTFLQMESGILNRLESDKLDLIYSAKKPVENVYLLLPFRLSAGKSLKVICQSRTIIRRQLLNRTPVYF